MIIDCNSCKASTKVDMSKKEALYRFYCPKCQKEINDAYKEINRVRDYGKEIIQMLKQQ